MELIKVPKIRKIISFEHLNQDADSNNKNIDANSNTVHNNFDLTAGNFCLLRFVKFLYDNIHAIFERDNEENKGKKAAKMNFPNEIMIMIFESFLRLERYIYLLCYPEFS